MINDRHGFSDDDLRFDRLVDGALSRDEYRELLGSLDDEPGGWRCCAMAFLEAQAWRRELSCLREDPRPSTASVRPSSRGSYALFGLAIAASFLLAFALGSQFRSWSSRDNTPNMVHKPAIPTPPSRRRHETAPLDQSLASSDATQESPSRPLGRATFVMDGNDGSSREIDMPVFQADNAYGKFMVNQATDVPRNIRRALQSLGYEVRRDLHWAPVELGDGRQIMVPFGEFEITPVSGGSFH